MDTEIGGDLLDRHPVITVAGHTHDIVAELTGVGPGHTDILPARPSRASQLRCHLFVQQTQAWALTPDELILYMPDYPVGHDEPIDFTPGSLVWFMDGGAVQAHIPLAALATVLQV
ncbi:hypothetical protein MINTM020_01450 [Mycobacterium paraintracellulare]|nr:hypothetical protein MINTM020_01450 [Mycobacterium paraintracellulare]